MLFESIGSEEAVTTHCTNKMMSTIEERSMPNRNEAGSGWSPLPSIYPNVVLPVIFQSSNFESPAP